MSHNWQVITIFDNPCLHAWVSLIQRVSRPTRPCGLLSYSPATTSQSLRQSTSPLYCNYRMITEITCLFTKVELATYPAAIGQRENHIKNHISRWMASILSVECINSTHQTDSCNCLSRLLIWGECDMKYLTFVR